MVWIVAINNFIPGSLRQKTGTSLAGSKFVFHVGFGKFDLARGEVRTSAGALVAVATGTFMFLPVPGGPKPLMEKRDEMERWKTS